jgi:hypothetical protein
MDRLPFPLPLPRWSEKHRRPTVFSTVDLLLFFAGSFSKPGKRSSGATAGVRQQKEELVHSVKSSPRTNQLRVGSHSGSAVHSAAVPRRFPRILLFLFWTVHGPFPRFLLEEKTGAPARPAAWGEEEGTEQSAVLAVRRGRSERSFFRRHGGVHCTSHRWYSIPPRPKGEQRLSTAAAPPPSPPARRAGGTPALLPTPGRWHTWARSRPAPLPSGRSSGG